MKKLLVLVAIVGLLLTLVPSMFVLYQKMSWTLHTQLMFIGMVLWFLSAPLLVKAD